MAWKYIYQINRYVIPAYGQVAFYNANLYLGVSTQIPLITNTTMAITVLSASGHLRCRGR